MQKKKMNKLNNGGFSLLEVLIAVIILAVVSIPLIQSLGSVAITNKDAKILMTSTECAENMMELIEQMTVEELVDLYNGNSSNTVTENADGSYSFSIKNTADFPSKLPNGYYLTFSLNPNLYPNNNAINIADVKSMSINDTAVYEMSSLYDDTIYSNFLDWNKAAVEMDSTAYMTATMDYFKNNLTRYIDVDIKKHGSALGADGKAVDQVTVSLDIRYEFKSSNLYWRYLPEDQKEYIEETREIFNNLATSVPLAGIYLFYQPRSIATQYGNTDVITINNPDNIETNLFIAAQSGDGTMASDALYYNQSTGPEVTIKETGASTASKAAITLFTNLCEEAPYSDLEPEDGKILCQLTYQDVDGYAAKKTGADAVKVLDARNLDGKTLTADDVKDRIYKVIATVYAPNGDKIVELDGTKLE